MIDYSAGQKQNFQPILVATLIAALFFLIGYTGLQLYTQIRESDTKAELSNLVIKRSDAIERYLEQSLTATRMLEIQIRLNKGNRDGFDQYAAAILAASPGVSNIQLAPEGIITDIYPLAGNEAAIGHNILIDDRRRDEARKAISTRKITLAGPFELIQGGVAVIGRQPVFLQKERQESFWGFTSALIHLENLLEVAQFEELERSGYAYELSFQEIATGKLKTIQQSLQPLGNIWDQAKIKVPNNLWTLKIGLPPAAAKGLDHFLFAGLVIATLLSFVISQLVLKKMQRTAAALRQLQNITDRQHFKDPLTGLCNRQTLMYELNLLSSELAQKPGLAALVLINLDNFRMINEKHGSEIGDEFLVQIARRITNLIRTNDRVARIAGDEFAVLIRNLSDRKAVTMVAEKLLRNINLPLSDIHESYVTASIGISLVQQNNANPEQIFRLAHDTMQQAKADGRNRYRFSSESDTSDNRL